MRISDWSSDVCSSDLFQQRLQQMLRPDPLMVHADGDGLRGLQKALGPIGEFLKVHNAIPSWNRADMVLPFCNTRASAAVLNQQTSNAGQPLLVQSSRRRASDARSEEQTSELQSLMRNSYDVLCMKNKK